MFLTTFRLESLARGGIQKNASLFTELSRKKTGMEHIETVLRHICHTSDTLTREEMETKLVQAFDEDRKGDIMTIADELRMEGEIRGEIKTYQRLMDNGLIPRELAEKKIAELSEKLEAFTVDAHMLPAGTSDISDQISA